MRLFLLEKRLWKVLVVLSNSIWTDSKIFSMKAKGLISQLRKFFVSITCLLTHWADYTPSGEVEVDLTIIIHPREESWVWTMAKEISSLLGELTHEGEEKKDWCRLSKIHSHMDGAHKQGWAYWYILDLWSQLLAWFEILVAGLSETTLLLSLIRFP